MSLLSACPPELAARWDAERGLHPGAARAFVQAQAREGLLHGRRPLCPVLSPLVLSGRLFGRMRSAAAHVLAAIERVAARALVDPPLADLLGLDARERDLYAREAALAAGAEAAADTVMIARLDAVFTGGEETDPLDRFAFLELNAESPAGLADQSAIEATLLRLPPVLAWLAETRHRPLDVPRALLRALRAGGAEGPGGPRTAIVDWAGGDTAPEQVFLRDFLAREGLPTCLADPGQLEYRGGRLLAHGDPVDLVYRRVMGRELRERAGDDHPLLRAARAGAVRVVNPFRSAIANRKAAFAVLSDPAWAHLFGDDQRAAIARHVPWTRLLGDPSVTEALLLQRQARLVIKPNDDYGGRGVVLGWTVPPHTWRAAVARGRAEGAVVQERLDCRRLSFPLFEQEEGERLGRLQWRTLGFDCDPFLIRGQVEGAMVRVSASPLSNVSAGGGVTGLLVLDDV